MKVVLIAVQILLGIATALLFTQIAFAIPGYFVKPAYILCGSFNVECAKEQIRRAEAFHFPAYSVFLFSAIALIAFSFAITSQTKKRYRAYTITLLASVAILLAYRLILHYFTGYWLYQ